MANRWFFSPVSANYEALGEGIASAFESYTEEKRRKREQKLAENLEGVYGAPITHFRQGPIEADPEPSIASALGGSTPVPNIFEGPPEPSIASALGGSTPVPNVFEGQLGMVRQPIIPSPTSIVHEAFQQSQGMPVPEQQRIGLGAPQERVGTIQSALAPQFAVPELIEETEPFMRLETGDVYMPGRNLGVQEDMRNESQLRERQAIQNEQQRQRTAFTQAQQNQRARQAQAESIRRQEAGDVASAYEQRTRTVEDLRQAAASGELNGVPFEKFDPNPLVEGLGPVEAARVLESEIARRQRLSPEQTGSASAINRARDRVLGRLTDLLQQSLTKPTGGAVSLPSGKSREQLIAENAKNLLQGEEMGTLADRYGISASDIVDNYYNSYSRRPQTEESNEQAIFDKAENEWESALAEIQSPISGIPQPATADRMASYIERYVMPKLRQTYRNDPETLRIMESYFQAAIEEMRAIEQQNNNLRNQQNSGFSLPDLPLIGN